MTFAYDTVKGYFLQDGDFVGSTAILDHFGLTIEDEDRWTKLLENLEEMNATSSPGEAYKLIFAARHGQAYHNLAEKKYGHKEWLENHAHKSGDGEYIWGPDPALTELGEQQALAAHAAWEKEYSRGAPLPQKLYCSPLTRAMRTCEITFRGIIDFGETSPIVLENCREIYGLYNCDQRSSLSRIRSDFPLFKVEDGFTEEDELHDSCARETHEHVIIRARSVLDRIFENDKETVISITAHSRFIKSLVIAANHDPVELPTGGILPIIIKSTRST